MSLRTLCHRPGVLFLLWLGLWLPSSAVQAVRVPVEVVELTVPDRGVQARQEALHRGMTILLVRLTGMHPVEDVAALEPLLRQPSRYLVAYSYRRLQQEAGAPPEGLLLRLRFDRAGVVRVLRRLGLPVWDPDRPAVVAWIALEDGGRRGLLGDAPDDPRVQALHRAAERRGLPLVLPLLDLEDTRAVRLPDVWGGFLEPLRQASLRYDARPAILAGRVRRDAAGLWRGRWLLDFAGEQQEWEATARDPAALLATGVDGVADRLAARLALRSTGSGLQIPVRVEGVEDLAAHLAVRRRLASLAPVQAVRLVRVASGEVEFLLVVEGGMAALESALGHLAGLEIVETTPLLRLRWVPAAGNTG
ncbi:MAG: DUF2066 domain-containing protein [Gammaproteobacteria bacterium]|nr:MAG: DUF2066 domain-containing protein [Gammaproteobacteria bacterium]